MKIRIKEWFTFILLAALCFGFWYKLEYPRFAFVDLSFGRQKASLKAEEFLRQKGVDTSKYEKSIVFDTDEMSDRYLQRTKGLKGEQGFITENDYDLFFWKVRFFKELQKEEFFVYISPRSGRVISYRHLIEAIEPRQDLGKDIAQKKAEAFLQNTFGVDLGKYDFHEEKIQRYEERIEYVFTWEKKGVYIPWKEGQGGAKLLLGVTVAGDEIRDFYKSRLDPPEKFMRYVENQLILGEYLFSIYFVLFLILLICSINIVLKKRNDLVARLSKKWFYYVGGFLAIIKVIGIFNNFRNIIMAYPTSVHMSSFLGLSITNMLISIGFLALCFVMPGIAGESLAREVFPQKRYSSFSHYLNSSFFNRGLTMAILFGYTIWVIMLGMQAVIFYFGQKFLGVWREWHTMTQFSSSYIPLLGAFIIASTASFSEEIIFRLFGISFTKKYLRYSVLAVVVPSIIWGMGHSTYAIFPVWFRIIEVSLIGIFYGFIFLRFGLIPLIVAHYLFDAFWSSAAYMLGHSTPYLFFSSLGVLCIPLGLALVAYFLNRGEEERQIHALLDTTQKYNLQILVTFISAKKSQGYTADMVKEELKRHNWDHSLVDFAVAEVFGR